MFIKCCRTDVESMKMHWKEISCGYKQLSNLKITDKKQNKRTKAVRNGMFFSPPENQG